VIISHDRWFLDRIATHMLAFEGDSQVEWFEGNYQDYEADRHRRSAPTPTSRTASSTSRWSGSDTGRRRPAGVIASVAMDLFGLGRASRCRSPKDEQQRAAPGKQRFQATARAASRRMSAIAVL
jgi:hypothetical protein